MQLSGLPAVRLVLGVLGDEMFLCRKKEPEFSGLVGALLTKIHELFEGG